VAAEGLKSNQSQSARVLALAEEGLTLREIALRSATPRGQFVGTPEQVADRARNGSNSAAPMASTCSKACPASSTFVDEVVPILQRRGIYKTDYPGQTFRDTLGLDVPVNRNTLARQRPLRSLTPPLKSTKTAAGHGPAAALHCARKQVGATLPRRQAAQARLLTGQAKLATDKSTWEVEDMPIAAQNHGQD
jgi:hypothetical protein